MVCSFSWNVSLQDGGRVEYVKSFIMKYTWNVDPLDPTTILRLISELEGADYILGCLDETEDEIKFISQMKTKYYKLYFKMNKIWEQQ